MRIGRVRLQQFGPYTDAEVIFDQPMSVVVAENTGGKTSLAKAIQLSLTRTCDGVQSDGKGSKTNVKLGAEVAVVTVGLGTAKGPVEVIATMPATGGIFPKINIGEGGDEAAGRGAADGFKRWLESSGVRLSCVLDSEYFVGQKTDEQRNILADLVLASSHDFDPKMKALAEKHIKGIDWNKPPAQVIDYIFGDNKRGVFAMRRDAKSTLGGIYIPDKPETPNEDSALVNMKLADLRSKHAKEAKKVKSGGTVQVGRIEQSIEEAEARIRLATQSLTETRAKRDAVERALLSTEALAALRDKVAVRKTHAEYEARIREAQAEVDAQQQAQELFEQLLQDEAGNTLPVAECPTCYQQITAAFVQGKVSEYKKAEGEAIAHKRELEDQKAKLPDFVVAERAIAENDARVQEKLSLTRKVAEDTERITLAEDTVEGLRKSLADAKAKEEAPPDTSVLDDLTEQIQSWEKKLSPAVHYESTIKQIEAANARWADQNAIVQELETLCAEFGPKGIKAKLIDESIGAFQEKVNEVLRVWGYVARLSIEPYSFEVMTPRTAPDYLPLKQLSGFEKKAFGVALQSAIAVFSKLKLILVDAADVMKGKRMVRLFGCIKAMLDAGTLEEAIVLHAVEENAPETKTKEGVGFYRIVDGKIERVA